MKLTCVLLQVTSSDALSFFMEATPPAAREVVPSVVGPMFVRTRGIVPRWEFVHVQLADSALRIHVTPKVAVNVIGWRARACTKDDRRHVVEAVSASGRSLYLQALSSVGQQEFMTCFNAMARNFKALIGEASADITDTHKFLYFEQSRDSDSDQEANPPSVHDNHDACSIDTTASEHSGKAQFVWGSATGTLTRSDNRSSHLVTVTPRPKLRPARPPPPLPPRKDDVITPIGSGPRANPFAGAEAVIARDGSGHLGVLGSDSLHYASNKHKEPSNAELTLSDLSDGDGEDNKLA